MRLSDASLGQLDALGNVRHVLRLGDFHGLDDRFYVDRYQAEFWCQSRPESYKVPMANHVINSTASPPMLMYSFLCMKRPPLRCADRICPLEDR